MIDRVLSRTFRGGDSLITVGGVVECDCGVGVGGGEEEKTLFGGNFVSCR